jgi:hypothetical protein
MCLTNLNIKKTKNLRKLRQDKTVYKVIQHVGRSIFEDYWWNFGYNASSRSSVKLSKWEKLLKEVDEGFHVFMSLQKAKKYLEDKADTQDYCYLYKIIKLRANTRHLVGIGKWRNSNCMVFTKVNYIKDI